ncbi:MULTISPECIES: late competence development ComFB family protein [Cyanophyceae]|uniref:late competence development ComFB family protein n=1 Tax=Cyanophyceae TaxID=3028117 RepID=UPI001686F4B1|nr:MULTISPECIES: late competence development ComFB family protein [Cyanophyceae]MBD1918498.1 late competence development ComFB family protein [Phormidium sp. FACHB-77]MBD2031387.1 late competence development ComFB family protein [Phormidium sp. FACHB-322]MBD2049507.1 late competence development ComFB family protein [Leptolyngbya sp. FACHB-60]
MKIDHDAPRHAYVNVMELLVSEEVEKQVKTMQPRMLKYLKRVEVETYALNRLPSLYASSEKGRQLQYEKAKRELHNQIKSAVRQAFAAVQVDPIRASEPLRNEQDDAASIALTTLRDLLKQPDLNWDGVINRLRSMLGRRGDQPPTAAPAQEPSHRTRYRNDAPEATAPGTDPDHGHHWRPGTYGSEVSWKKTHNSGSAPSGSNFDWHDNRYSK